jgi:hypothetical protein
VELPQALHAQLYLVAYDPQRHRFRFDRDNRRDNGWLFCFALRAAMLTDLYLSGHVEDKQGKAHPTSAAWTADPVLHEALKGVAGREWAKLIARNERHASRVVRDQLKTIGWLRAQRHRMLGVIPTTRLGIYDEDMVSALTDQVILALRNAIDDRPADPRPLALGLLAVQAQMPVVSIFDNWRQRQDLREMTFAAIEPILGLHHAIQVRLTDMRSNVRDIGLD